MKIGYFILGALMLVSLLVCFFAPPIYLLDDYTLRDVGFGLFALSFFLVFLMIVAAFSQKKDK
jgi:hypothetical protein